MTRSPGHTTLFAGLSLTLLALGACASRQQVGAQSPEHLAWAKDNDAGTAAFSQTRYDEAATLFAAAMAHGERFPAPDARLATSLNNLASVYRAQRRYAQAEPLDRRALAIQEQALGNEHLYVATSLLAIADSVRAQGRYDEAAPLAVQALHIRKRLLPPEHPDIAACDHTLALIYSAQGRYEEAEPLFQRALEIDEATLGPHHPTVAFVLDGYAALLRKSPRAAEAAALEARAQAIRAEHHVGGHAPSQ